MERDTERQRETKKGTETKRQTASQTQRQILIEKERANADKMAASLTSLSSSLRLANLSTSSVS